MGMTVGQSARVAGTGLVLVVLAWASPFLGDTPFPAETPGDDLGVDLPAACGVGRFEASGSVWHPFHQALFLAGDQGQIAWVDATGTVLDCVSLDGAPDLEGFTLVDPQSSIVYAAIEDPDAILVFDPLNPCTGTTPTTAIPCVTFDLTGILQSAATNQGLEALTFVPVVGHAEGGLFYAGLQEDGRIYVLDVPLSSGGASPVELIDTLTPVPGLTDLAGLHYERDADRLLAIFDTSDRLVVSGSDAVPDTCYAMPSGKDQEGVVTSGCDLFLCDDTDGTVRRHSGFPSASDDVDTDGDGVGDCADDCPGTALAVPVGSTGCACGQNLPVVCGDGLCDPTGGENCINCESDCNGQQQGNPGNRFCCGDEMAGDGPVGCDDPRCTANPFACGTPSCCGDFTCGPNESPCDCPLDCGVPVSSEIPGSSCGDGNDNDCDGLADCLDPDCCTASACGPDTDSDGVTACDCDDDDALVWSHPGGVVLSWSQPEELTWTPPAVSGGSIVAYDVLRADDPFGFLDATCLETDDTNDTVAPELAVPPPSVAWYYLVRSGNACVGEGSLGNDSAGRVRFGIPCQNP